MYRCPVCPDAVAKIRGGELAASVCGTMRFYQERGSVLIEAEISGLPRDSKSGFYGLHIHEGGSCCCDAFSETGGHYDPKGVSHPYHAGDLPPLMQCHDGAYLAMRTDRFCVRDIIGKTVVIHSEPDDFRTQPSGNAGKKIACGLICGLS